MTHKSVNVYILNENEKIAFGDNATRQVNTANFILL